LRRGLTLSRSPRPRHPRATSRLGSARPPGGSHHCSPRVHSGDKTKSRRPVRKRGVRSGGAKGLPREQVREQLVRVKRHLAVLVALVSVGLVAGALGALPANADPPNIRRDGGVHYIRGGGSDTTYEMMVGLADQYNATPGCITSQSGFTFPENGTCIDFDPVTPGIQPHWEDPVIQAGANPDHNIIWQFYPYGSSNGIKVLTDTGQPNVTERFRFARSSRAPSGSDPAGLRFVGYARDAIPWVKYDDAAVATEPSDGVTNLTQAQLQGIFTGCTNTNWNQVGGNNGPIIVWSAQNGSGTRSTFDGFVGGDSTTCIPANQKDGNTA